MATTGEPTGSDAAPDTTATVRDRRALGVFVGRNHELSHGLALLDDSAAGEGRLLLISGEPGIGKSRLADELARHARDRGFLVAWGRCWEVGGAPAYWPWVQSLRSLVRGMEGEALQAALGDDAHTVSQMLPELRITGGATTLPHDPEAARFELFESVTKLLKHIARSRPVLLVLDDLHAADTPSLLLLRFVAGELGEDRIMVMALYRDIDPALGGALAETVTELMRGRMVSRLAVRGIAEVDVPRFVEAVTGVVPAQSLAHLVHRETDGNPLFLQEMARVLLGEGGLGAHTMPEQSRLPVPRSVRDVIARRVRPFSEACMRVLRLAAILGREFSIDALVRLAELPRDDMLELLQAPLEEQVLSEVPESHTRLRFGHVLIRECLYDDISRARRRQLHRAAVGVLEALYRDDIESHLSELAHHAYDGAGDGHWDQAISYARQAGDQALSLLAYEEAARLQRQALDSLDQSRANDPLLRCELLLALGDAQARAGDEAGAKSSFVRAAELGRTLRRGDHVARAALGYAGRHAWGRAGGDTHLVPLLTEGAEAVGTADSALRALLLARLAGALRDSLDSGPREAFAREAVTIARRLDDPATLAYALDGLYGATYGPDNVDERTVIANEIVRLGEAADDREVQLWGHLNRLLAFFELGDLGAVHGAFSALKGVAGELGQPVLRWFAASTEAALALAEGRFADAEQLATAALQFGQRSVTVDALPAYIGQLFNLRREQGRLAEVADDLRRAERDYSWYPFFRCALATLHLELGQPGRASATLDAFAAEAFRQLPFDNYWVYNMSLLGELAHGLHNRRAAELLYERLTPYAFRNAFAPPEGCIGSVSRVLGLLATTLERPDAAAKHFEDALAHNERMGTRPSLAHTQYAYALLVLAEDGAPERRAYDLLTQARQTCMEIGMPVLDARIAAVLARQQPAPAPSPPPAAIDHGAIVLEGEYWAMTYAGRTVRLRASKGLRVLATLLATPGRPHPSLVLERIGEAGDDPTAHALATSDAGELLDQEAQLAYRARIGELRAAIEDARVTGNAREVDTLQEELDFITRELSRGLGLGGRARRAGSTAERARINVTRAVKTALQRIAGADAELGAHLQATIRTGIVCAYTPDPRSPIEWRVQQTKE